MENVILIIAVVIVAFVVVSRVGRFGRVATKTLYQYRAKPIMTRREQEVFRRLVRIFGQKFYVLPQVYLGAILNHEIKGQNWNGAFQHINRKSVDYALLNQETLELVCTVELDDGTHRQEKRQERDREVERILKQAQIPLVRIRDVNRYSDKEIVEIFAQEINGKE